MHWTSPTYGKLDLEETIRLIERFISEPDRDYRFAVGTDSQVADGGTRFVSSLVIHKVGQHAIFFYQMEKVPRPFSFQERMYEETSRSLHIAEMILQQMQKISPPPLSSQDQIEIHLDIGKKGRTRQLLPALSGMVAGCGYRCFFKPNAFGASSVADRFTRR